MHINGVDPLKVIVVIITTLALLFGGQILYRHFTYNKPLVEELSSVNGVKDYRVISENNGVKLSISMSPVDNLQASYLAIEDVLNRIYANTPEITIDDAPSSKLKELWYQGQFVIYEGISTGQFVKMEKQLGDIAANYPGVAVKVFVDTERVYFQAVDGKHFLYKVIGRKQGGGPFA